MLVLLHSNSHIQRTITRQPVLPGISCTILRSGIDLTRTKRRMSSLLMRAMSNAARSLRRGIGSVICGLRNSAVWAKGIGLVVLLLVHIAPVSQPRVSRTVILWHTRSSTILTTVLMVIAVKVLDWRLHAVLSRIMTLRVCMSRIIWRALREHSPVATWHSDLVPSTFSTILGRLLIKYLHKCLISLLIQVMDFIPLRQQTRDR